MELEQVKQGIALTLTAVGFIGFGSIVIRNVCSHFHPHVEKNLTTPIPQQAGKERSSPDAQIDHRPRTRVQVVGQQYSRQRPLSKNRH